MSDALRLEEGTLPWLPAHDIDAGEVVDYYDVPRAGLLHQAGMTYYFECILGDGETGIGFWAYSLLDDDEILAVLSASGPAEFDALTPKFIQHRWVTVAIAANDRILESAVLDAGLEGAVGLAQRMVKRWRSQQEARESASRLVETMPA